MIKYPIPMQARIIWHPAGDALCRPLAARIYLTLIRDPHQPLPPGSACLFSSAEETLFSIEAGHAVYDLGGFGGAFRLVAAALADARVARTPLFK